MASVVRAVGKPPPSRKKRGVRIKQDTETAEQAAVGAFLSSLELEEPETPCNTPTTVSSTRVSKKRKTKATAAVEDPDDVFADTDNKDAAGNDVLADQQQKLLWLSDFKRIAQLVEKDESDTKAAQACSLQPAHVRVIENELITSLQQLPIVSFFSIGQPQHLAGDSTMPEHPDDQAARHADMLRTRTETLPVLTAQYESELLQQSGRFVHPVVNKPRDFPPCVKGTSCVGMVYASEIRGFPKGGGCILTQLMLPDEYEALLSDNLQPVTQRMCILCCRVYVCSFVLKRRMAGDRVQLSDTLICQYYRNLCDCNGGYKYQHLLVPKSHVWEGFLDFFCTPSLDSLFAKKVGNRWVIDQSGLMYSGDDMTQSNVAGTYVKSMLPENAETLQGFNERYFRERSDRQPKKTGTTTDAKATKTTTSASTGLPPRVCTNWYKFIHRRVCTLLKKTQSVAFIVKNYKLRPSYTAGVSFDMTAPIHAPKDPRLPALLQTAITAIPVVDGLVQTECTDCCINVHSLLCVSGFGSQPRSSKSTVTTFVGKAWPRRCMTRMLDGMINAAAEQNSRPVFVALRSLLYVCLSASGHYYADRQRPSTYLRYWLMAFFLSKHPVFVDASVHMMTNHAHLVVFAIREHIQICAKSDPALRACVEASFDPDVFATNVTNAMNKARSLIVELMRESIQTYITRWKDKNPNQEIDANIAILVRYLPLQNRTGSLADMDTQFTQSYSRILKTAKLNRVVPFFDVIYSSGANRLNRAVCRAKRSKRKKEKVAQDLAEMERIKQLLPDSLANCIQCMVALHAEPLLAQQAVDCLDEYNEDQYVEVEILSMLSKVGIPASLIKLLCGVVAQYYTGGISKRILGKFFVRLEKELPFLGACVALMSCCVERARTIRVYDLPAHYLAFQIDALSSRFPVESKLVGYPVIPIELCEITLCSVCFTLYSLLCRETKIYKQTYCHGYLNMRVDYSALPEPIPMCNRHHLRFFPSRSCEYEHIRRVITLGKLVRVNRTLLMLCPGEGCGRPMVLDLQRSIYTARGFVCSICSKKAKELAYRALIGASAVARVCDVCGRENVNPAFLHLFPYGVTVCKRHKIDSLCVLVRNAMYDGLVCGRNTCLKLITDACLTHKRSTKIVRK
jgi:hypothetical protein